jgi:hypothetical protein
LRLQGYSDDFESIEYDPIGRFSTDVWRLRLAGGSTGAHPRLILKRPYQAPRTGEPTDLEAEFYERVAATLTVPSPGFIGKSGDCLIITELPELQAFDFQSGPTQEHAGLAMEGLAELHASRWNETSDLDWIPDLGDPTLRKAWEADFDVGWKNNHSSFHERCPLFTPIGDALVGRLAEPPNLATEKNAGHGVFRAPNPQSPVRMRLGSTAKTPRNRGNFSGKT